jgi:hypothetical protein
MDVTTKFSGDEKDLIAAMNRIERQNTKLIEQNRRLAGQARRAKRETHGMFDSATKSALKFAGAMVGGMSIASGLQRVMGLANEAQGEIKALAGELVGAQDQFKQLW